MNIVFALVNPVDVLMAVGYTHVRIYSDVSASGAFTTLVTAVPMVADQESITYVHVAGTDLTWYKTSYYGASVTESDKSAAFQANVFTSYASVLELRNVSNQLNNVDDLSIQMALDAAKFTIDEYTNHPLGFITNPTPSAKLYSAAAPDYLFIDECTSVTLVEVKASPTDTTYEAWGAGTWIACTGAPDYPDYNTTPYDLLIQSGTGIQQLFSGFGSYGWPDQRRDYDITNWLNRLPNVRVTATWGYSDTCPPSVKLATIAQATRWLKRGQSAWADTLASSDFGSLQYRKPLDPDIQMMLTNARLVKPATGRR